MAYNAVKCTCVLLCIIISDLHKQCCQIMVDDDGETEFFMISIYSRILET